MSGLSCPACGKTSEWPISEASVDALEAELRRIKAALRQGQAPAVEAPFSGGSIWDRPRSTASSATASAFSSRSQKEADALASWGFLKPKTEPEPEPPKAELPPKAEATVPNEPATSGLGGAVREPREFDRTPTFGTKPLPSGVLDSAPSPGPEDIGPRSVYRTPTFGAKPLRAPAPAPQTKPLEAKSSHPFGGRALDESTRPSPFARGDAPAIKRPDPANGPRRGGAAALRQEAERRGGTGAPGAHAPEAEAPPVRAKRELAPSTLIASLNAHPNLNPGQRATVQMIYDRFAPKSPIATENISESLVDALNADPNLNAGQRETLRTVVERFDRKR